MRWNGAGSSFRSGQQTREAGELSSTTGNSPPPGGAASHLRDEVGAVSGYCSVYDVLPNASTSSIVRLPRSSMCA